MSRHPSDIESMESQVVSKQRVVDHGEVLTGSTEVSAMLALVDEETRRIESRFLEPACGSGNFLSAILASKLHTVNNRYAKSQPDFERNCILAISSLYGIDILADNVHECRSRLFSQFEKEYGKSFGQPSTRGQAVVKFILARNIVWGDALTLTTAGEGPRPILFSEWSAVNTRLVKRRDFSFRDIVEQRSMHELPLFSDLGEEVFVAAPEKDFAPVHYLALADVEDE